MDGVEDLKGEDQRRQVEERNVMKYSGTVVGRWRLWARVMAVPLSVITVGACSGGESTSGSDRITPLKPGAASTSTSTPPSTAAPSTTTTTLRDFGVDPELVRQVWGDLVAAFRAVDDAAADPNPDNPTLAQHLTGPMLDHWRQRFSEWRVAGEYAYYPETSQRNQVLMGVRVISPNFIRLDTCFVDDGIRAVRSTGEIRDDAVVTVRAWEGLQRVEGGWKWAEQTDGIHDAQDLCPGL